MHEEKRAVIQTHGFSLGNQLRPFQLEHIRECATDDSTRSFVPRHGGDHAQLFYGFFLIFCEAHKGSNQKKENYKASLSHCWPPETRVPKPMLDQKMPGLKGGLSSFTSRRGTTLLALRSYSAVRIKFKLHGQDFFGAGRGVSPLLYCLHRGLTQNRISSEQLCAFHSPVGRDDNLYPYHSPDIKSLQSFRIIGLYPGDHFPFCCTVVAGLGCQWHYAEKQSHQEHAWRQEKSAPTQHPPARNFALQHNSHHLVKPATAVLHLAGKPLACYDRARTSTSHRPPGLSKAQMARDSAQSPRARKPVQHGSRRPSPGELTLRR